MQKLFVIQPVQNCLSLKYIYINLNKCVDSFKSLTTCKEDNTHTHTRSHSFKVQNSFYSYTTRVFSGLR